MVHSKDQIQDRAQGKKTGAFWKWDPGRGNTVWYKKPGCQDIRKRWKRERRQPAPDINIYFHISQFCPGPVLATDFQALFWGLILHILSVLIPLILIMLTVQRASQRQSEMTALSPVARMLVTSISRTCQEGFPEPPRHKAAYFWKSSAQIRDGKILFWNPKRIAKVLEIPNRNGGGDKLTHGKIWSVDGVRLRVPIPAV